LIRTRLAADREAGLSGSTELVLAKARQESTEFAGTCLSPVFINDLENAKLTVHEQVRTVQLDGSAAQADAYISGKPLWRQSEPDEDHWLAQQIAGDIAAWVHR
jgi:hypothetical protein